MVQIIQDIIPPECVNRPLKPCTKQYITIHNTGNASRGANAASHAKYIKGADAANRCVSWHYTVDEKHAIQHIPDDEVAWHAADQKGNASSIGIEICMNIDGDLLAATNNAAELAAYLCSRYAIPLSNVVTHKSWSGKACPQMLLVGKPYKWIEFLDRVKNYASLHPVKQEAEQQRDETTKQQPIVKPNTGANELYRVRKEWSDPTSQVGAYIVYDNAVNAAKKRKGYKVFNEKGEVVFEP